MLGLMTTQMKNDDGEPHETPQSDVCSNGRDAILVIKAFAGRSRGGRNINGLGNNECVNRTLHLVRCKAEKAAARAIDRSNTVQSTSHILVCMRCPEDIRIEVEDRTADVGSTCRTRPGACHASSSR
eukprot:scaffold122643_cov33-Tisochrysis_lutea.AAC.1